MELAMMRNLKMRGQRSGVRHQRSVASDQSPVLRSPSLLVSQSPPRPVAPSPSRCLAPAFTMIELMVVVGILGLLLAIILPTANRILANTKIKSTLATMQIIENAIERYENDRPFGKLICDPAYSTSTNFRYTHHFDSLPPDDFALLSEDFQDTPPASVLDNDRWDPGELIENGAGVPRDMNGNKRFDVACLSRDIAGVSSDVINPNILAWMRNPLLANPDPDIDPQPNNPNPVASDNARVFDSDYRPIEALYLYISIFSPQGKAILDKLPSSVIGNKDQCSGAPCPDILIIGKDNTGKADLVNGKRLDLFEIYDSWGRAMRYAVKPPVVDRIQCRAEVPASWELRSAGPDGKFAAMFTPEDASDDVVLRGQ